MDWICVKSNLDVTTLCGFFNYGCKKLDLLRVSHKSPINPNMQLHVNPKFEELGTQFPSFKHGLKVQGGGSTQEDIFEVLLQQFNGLS